MEYFTTRSHLPSGCRIKNFSDFTVDKRHYNAKNPTSGDYGPERFYDILIHGECEKIIEHFEKDASFYDVGVQGLPSNTEVGSRRITAYDEGFSRFLTSILASRLSPVILDEYSPVDWQSQNPGKLNYWVPLGVSTMFRYMRYRRGSQHYTHYDAPYIHPENPLIRTLQSGVLYLTDSASCCTCFVDDKQSGKPFVKRNHSDWDRETLKEEIVARYRSVSRSALLFFHQLPHFVTKHEGDNDRIIIRFDVTYRAVGRV